MSSSLSMILLLRSLRAAAVTSSLSITTPERTATSPEMTDILVTLLTTLAESASRPSPVPPESSLILLLRSLRAAAVTSSSSITVAERISRFTLIAESASTVLAENDSVMDDRLITTPDNSTNDSVTADKSLTIPESSLKV